MTTISQRRTSAQVQARAKGQSAQRRARSHPHLPDARGAAAPRRHPLHLFRSHRSQVVDRLRHASCSPPTASSWRCSFFCPACSSGRALPERAPLNYLSRSPASARPALRDLRVHDHSDRLLRDLAAAASRDRLHRILVEDDHRRPVAERADLVPLGAARLRPRGKPAVSAVAHAARSDQPPVAARPTSGPADFFWSCLPSPPRFYVPGRVHFGPGSWFEFGPFSVQHGRVLLYADLLLLRRRHRRCEYGSRAAGADGRLAKGSWDWVVAGARSVLPDVGADLHQARNPGKPGDAAGMVRGDLWLLLRSLQRGHPVR